MFVGVNALGLKFALSNSSRPQRPFFAVTVSLPVSHGNANGPSADALWGFITREVTKGAYEEKTVLVTLAGGSRRRAHAGRGLDCFE